MPRLVRPRLTVLAALTLLCLAPSGCRPAAPSVDAGPDAALDAAAELDAARIDGGRGDVGPLTRPRDGAMRDAPDTGPCGDCSLLTGPCASAHCDTTEMRCVVDFFPPGTECDDQNPCTGDATCDAIGACVGTPTPADPPQACDDENPCTLDDACNGEGFCVGTPRDCSALDGPCAEGVCRAGECTVRSAADCRSCIGDPAHVCVAGECVAPPTPLHWTFDDGLPASWESGGDAPWVAAPGAGHLGGVALASGVIGASRTSEATLRFDTSWPVELTFSYRVSSEDSWDFFRVYVDGQPMPRLVVSGEVGWTAAAPLRFNEFSGPTAHTVRFVYDKDGSLSGGEDRVFIDDVRLVRLNALPVVVVAPGGAIEGFEAGLPAGARTDSGPTGWFADTFVAYEGVASVASGAIGDNQSTDLELDVRSTANQGVEVLVRTSTEDRYDFFELLVDGVVGARLAGEHDWTVLAAELGPAGDHVVTLRYRKDVNTIRGADRVWVDALRIGPVVASPPPPGPCR